MNERMERHARHTEHRQRIEIKQEEKRTRHLCVAVLVVALLALSPTAEAFIVNWMPIFGVVNGLDVARLNVALADVLSGPCHVSLGFVNEEPRMVQDPEDFTLQGVEGVFIDFIGDPNLRVGSRVRLRARVALADPQESAPSVPRSASKCSTV
jgi:hypothetical protein